MDFDPRDLGGPSRPQLGPNFQSRVTGWMRDYATRVSKVTGVRPAANPVVRIVDREGMVDALTGVTTNVLPSVPSPLPGAGDWFAQQVARQMSRAMSKDVLGLYVPEWQSGGQTPALYLVAENIEEAAAKMGLDPEALAHYVAFHEATHQWQFTGHPWLEQHMKDATAAMSQATTNLKPTDLLRSVIAGGDVFSAIPGIAETQATMSLIEGYADFMTEALGTSQDPELARVAAALDTRRADRIDGDRTFIQELLGRLGLDAKRRQYADGKAFCEAVVAQGGQPLLNKVWTSADTLPSPREMKNPSLWVARMTRPGQAAA